MPSLIENMKKLLELFKEIAVAIREKRHYNRVLLIAEMPDEIRKIGDYKDWERETTNSVYTEDSDTDFSSNVTISLDHQAHDRFCYLVYQDDGNSYYPHIATGRLLKYEAFLLCGQGDSNYYMTTGYQEWKEHRTADIRVETTHTVRDEGKTLYLSTSSYYIEQYADWWAKLFVGGRGWVD